MSTTIHLQVEGDEILLFDVRGREPNCIAVLDAAAALELAKRLKTTALRLDTGCRAYTQGGTRCSLEKGHKGNHVTGTGGWFKHAGAPEQACR